MIALNNASVIFNQGTVNENQALSNINLNVREGDFITIIGSNGAGKSTLFNLIAGTITPTAGSIHVNGRNVTREPDRIYAAQEDTDSAIAACLEVLKLFPDNSEAKNFVAALREQLKPGWHTVLSDVIRFLPSLAKGALMTLMLVFCTMLVSPLGGLLLALGRISTLGPVSGICWFIIWFFSGTPLLLQLFFIYYGLPSLGITLPPFTAAVIGLGLNYSAYLGEIIRGAIQSIDHGRMEAAKAIGMSYGQAMRRVIIPQTYKRLMPPVGNEFIALIKDTALVSTIAMVELMRAADQLFNTYFNITALALAAGIYLVLSTIFTFIFEKIEYRAGIYEHR